MINSDQSTSDNESTDIRPFPVLIYETLWDLGEGNLHLLRQVVFILKRS